MTSFAAPRSLTDALGMLAEEPELRPIAGCTDLMVGDPADTIDLAPVLDLTAIPELRGIRPGDGDIRIGATTTFSEIRKSELVRDRYPALAAAAASIGGWQIQNRATIGGNIVNASPAGDSLPVLLALEASIVTATASEQRTIPFSSFFTGYRQTRLRAGEIVTEVRLPHPSPSVGQYFCKVGTRQAQAISKVVVALAGRVEGGRFAEFKLAAGSVAATPIRLTAVEERMIGSEADGSAAALAGRAAAGAVEPIDDVRSTAAYRRFVLERIVRRLTLKLLAEHG